MPWAPVPCPQILICASPKACPQTATSSLCWKLCRTNRSLCWPFDKVSKMPGPRTGPNYDPHQPDRFPDHRTFIFPCVPAIQAGVVEYRPTGRGNKGSGSDCELQPDNRPGKLVPTVGRSVPTIGEFLETGSAEQRRLSPDFPKVSVCMERWHVRCVR